MPPLFSTPSSLSTRFLSFEIEGNQIVCHVNITNANLKMHFYKQRQAEIRKKKKAEAKQKLRLF